MRNRDWLAPVLATGVFSVCFALTLALMGWHVNQNATIARQQLALVGNALAERLSLRIHSFDNALLGLRGGLAGNADRARSYREFDRVVGLMQQYPGALSVGYAERVSQDKTSNFLERLGKQRGQPIPLRSTHVNNGDRFIVVEASGKMQLGTDLAAESPVREAGMRATWQNEAVLSPPVDEPEGSPPSFYLLLPVYADGVDPKDSMLRHEHTVGWLFIQLSGERLMNGISDPALHLQLIDHQEDGEPTVVFDDATSSDSADSALGQAGHTPLPLQLDHTVGGRVWQLVLTPRESFQEGLGQLSPRLGLAFGSLVSALAGMLTYSLLVMQRRAALLAERMTIALRTSEKHQRAILENASVGIIFTSDQKTAHCNPKAAELFGWGTPQDMLGMPGALYWPSADDYREVGERAGPALSAGAVFEAERSMRRKDGSTFLAHIRAKAIDPAAPSAGTIWITEDVTEQRRMETLLKEGERRLSQIIDGSPIAIFVIDTDHRVTHWNGAIEHMTAVKASSVIGTRDCWRGFYAKGRPTMANLIVNNGSAEEIGLYYGEDFERSQLVPGAVAAEGFFPHMPPNGRWLHFTAAPLRDADGKLMGAIETLTDITERKAAQQMLAQRSDALQQSNQELGQAMTKLTETQRDLVRSEKLAGLGAMVVGVAHEMNTPLGVCLMAASTLHDKSKSIQDTLNSGLRRTVLEQFVEDSLTGSSMLIDNLARMARLIKNFKRVAVHQSTAQRSQFDLAQIVSIVVHAARSRHSTADVFIEQQVPEGIVLNSFLDELDQVLTSLVSNAIRHGLEGRAQGHIVIHAQVDATRGVVALTVTDNGRGIAPEILPRIFDPFFTTKLGVGDSGLGLNISYNQITGILGGTIDVSSTVEVGTCFTLTLPLLAP
jgi:PAS domain S-box-containing protein